MAVIKTRHLLSLVLAFQWHLAVHLPSHFFAVAESVNTKHQRGENDELADFGQTISIKGQMERTDQDFKDGLALDLFSPQNRTLIVQKNTSPLPGHFVSGTTGEPFLALSNYSWVIKVNDTARDLIAKVELPYEPDSVHEVGCTVANTYVGVLSRDGKSWMVDESRRNVHISENKTRIVKLTSLDGEYILLGRQTVDTANIFVQYGFGATRTVNLTEGKGIQQAEFIDGLRLSVELDKKMQINVDLKNGIDPRTVPTGMRSLYSFAWAINSSVPNQLLKRASVRFPVNISLLAPSNTNISTKSADFVVAKRDPKAQSFTTFEPISRRQQKMECWPAECQVEVFDLQQLDREYVILTADEGASKVEETGVREPFSNSPISSIGTTIHKNKGWAGTYSSMYSLAAILLSVFL